MPRAYKPEGYNDLSPYLIVKHAGQLMDLLSAAFAAEILLTEKSYKAYGGIGQDER